MTDAELVVLIGLRERARVELCPKRSRLTLGAMSPEQRETADWASQAFREAARRIVAELRRRGAPFEHGGRSYRLTFDKLSFVECSAAGEPVDAPRSRGGPGDRAANIVLPYGGGKGVKPC